MDWKNLVVAVLTPVVAFGVKALFALIGFELDEATFAALVGAIVTYFASLFFQNTGARAIRSFRS